MDHRELKESFWKKKNALKLERAKAVSKTEKERLDKEIERCDAVLSHIETRTSARLHTTNLF